MKKTVVFLSAKARAGKDTAADILLDELSKEYIVDRYKFANRLKEYSKNDFSILYERFSEYFLKIKEDLIEANVSEDIINSLEQELIVTDDNFESNKNIISRSIMEVIGTEIFRNKFSDSYWRDIVKNEILEDNVEIAFITDVRFDNEIDMFDDNDDIKTLKVRINRSSLNDNNNHPSNISLDKYDKFDVVIENDSSLLDFENKVKELINRIV